MMGPLIPIAMQLAQYAPNIIKILSGSDKAAEVAEKVVGVAQAITGQPDGESALAALKADPNKVLEFQEAMAAQQLQLEQMYLADTQNARARDVDLAKVGILNYRANMLAGGAGALVVFCLAIMVWRSGLDNDAKAVITLILGRALGWIEQVFSFEFGTTRANKVKDDTIKALSK
ncbi:hypothetical protein [Massilia endophytica]|uniref:hypothetical protein n=1 Tax=Massilia endophytica TaxID=2899220 RepID=UPI001E50AAF7|nr:hypothetical protein [Massilia endophytica]UGQ44984.1 hypothetical protein LSQ66_14375 [Massilia endophytica]